MIFPRSRLLPLVWCMACGACVGAGGESRAPAVLLLGSGEARYESFQSGDHLELHAGTQGGHHVWLSMRVRGLDPERIRMLLDITPSAKGAPPVQTDIGLRFAPVSDDAFAADAGGGDWYEFVGWPARILSPECAVGEPVHVEVTLEDERGHTASAELDVIPDPPKAGFVVECEP